MNTPNRRRIVAMAVLISNGLLAQTTAQPAAPAAANDPEEEVVLLSPFEVRADSDSGYVATQTLAGSRINTRLEDVGSAISVVTAEFLRDTGATDNKTLLCVTICFRAVPRSAESRMGECRFCTAWRTSLRLNATMLSAISSALFTSTGQAGKFAVVSSWRVRPVKPCSRLSWISPASRLRSANRALERRGKVDTFSIVKFRHKTNGTVTTEEFGIPAEIKTDQPWIGEAPIGDWFYGPNFTYDSGMMIHYIVEAVAHDGNAALCIPMREDGSLDAAADVMLQEVGVWMRRNGEAVYGSHAWKIPGEGEIVDGKLKMLPGGKLGRLHAEFAFAPQDFRFTIGKSGALYAFCMTVPAAGTTLKIRTLGADATSYGKPIKAVRLLGHEGELPWKQEAGGLAITCPAEMPFSTSVVFRIE